MLTLENESNLEILEPKTSNLGRWVLNPHPMDNHLNSTYHSRIPNPCRGCVNRFRGLCGTLSDGQILILSKYARLRLIEPGTELIREKIPTNNYYIIISGVLKLSKLMIDGRQQFVGLQFAPDCIGRPFHEDSRVNVVAATEVKICSISRSILDLMIAEIPELKHRLFKQKLNELDAARDWLLTLGRKTASEKVASLLSLVAIHSSPNNQENAIEFDLPMCRADIADFLGLTTETVCRQITKLRKEKVIKVVNDRHIIIPDLTRLLRRADSLERDYRHTDNKQAFG